MAPYRGCWSLAERRHDDDHRLVSVTALLLVDLSDCGPAESRTWSSCKEASTSLSSASSTYKTCHYAANLCVHATSESQKPIVILFPHEVHLRELLASNANLPAPDTDLHKLCEDQSVKEFYLRDLQAIAKKNGFKAIEIVQGVVLSPEEWTPESGLVTAAQKVQRKAVEKKYQGANFCSSFLHYVVHDQ